MTKNEYLNFLFEGDKSPSRRLLLRTVVTMMGGVVAVLGTISPAVARMSQKAAGYQLTPKDGQSCANCALFKAPSACTLVDGVVVAPGYCRFYEKKTS
jgi:hypothetical protein